MSTIGQPECVTQNRVIGLFRDELGYRYLGDWSDRGGNSTIEGGFLSKSPRSNTATVSRNITRTRSTGCPLGATSSP